MGRPRRGRLIACDNAWACDAPVVILAVHAESAIPTVQEHADRLAARSSCRWRTTSSSTATSSTRCSRRTVRSRPRSRRCCGARGCAPRSIWCPRPSSARSTTRCRATSSCSATTTRPRPPSWRSRAASRACAPLDGGSLRNAVGMETFAAVLLTVNIRHKMRASLRLTSVEGDRAGPSGAGSRVRREHAPLRHRPARGRAVRAAAHACACTCAASRRTTRPTSGTRRRTSPTTCSSAGSRSSGTRSTTSATSPTSTTPSCPRRASSASRTSSWPRRRWRASTATWTRSRCAPPIAEPRATESIDLIIELVGQLLESGNAYLTHGTAYFDVSTFPRYGELSHYSEEQMVRLARARGGNPDDPHRRQPLDFVLWQPSLADEPAWRAPFGVGRPGWHIECSAMAMHEHGPTIDLHGGGTDLIFPHHECEIAQSESLTGKPFVTHWLHSAMVNYEGEKMSKSLGNLVFVDDLLKRADPPAIRLALMRHHYRARLRVVPHRSRGRHRAAAPAARRGRARRPAPTRAVRAAGARRDRRRPRHAARARRARRPRRARSSPAATTPTRTRRLCELGGCSASTSSVRSPSAPPEPANSARIAQAGVGSLDRPSSRLHRVERRR